jgi:hypothetical protein
VVPSEEHLLGHGFAKEAFVMVPVETLGFLHRHAAISHPVAQQWQAYCEIVVRMVWCLKSQTPCGADMEGSVPLDMFSVGRCYCSSMVAANAAAIADSWEL